VLVNELMKDKVATARISDNLEKALELMKKNKVSSLVVLKKKNVCGIITYIDIAKSATSLGGLRKIKVKSAMPKKLFSIGPRENIMKATELMKKEGIRRLPVIEEGELKGIITSADLMEHQNEIFFRAQRILSLRSNLRDRFSF